MLAISICVEVFCYL